MLDFSLTWLYLPVLTVTFTILKLGKLGQLPVCVFVLRWCPRMNGNWSEWVCNELSSFFLSYCLSRFLARFFVVVGGTKRKKTGYGFCQSCSTFSWQIENEPIMIEWAYSDGSSSNVALFLLHLNSLVRKRIHIKGTQAEGDSNGHISHIWNYWSHSYNLSLGRLIFIAWKGGKYFNALFIKHPNFVQVSKRPWLSLSHAERKVKPELGGITKIVHQLRGWRITPNKTKIISLIGSLASELWLP